MHNIDNPFARPELLHPELAQQIAETEARQQGRDSSTELATSGLTAVVQDSERLQQQQFFETLDPGFMDKTLEAREHTFSLFNDVDMLQQLPDQHVPEIYDHEFKNIDWKQLEQGYQAYIEKGLQPEIVIAPRGLQVKNWKELYGELWNWHEKLPSETKIEYPQWEAYKTDFFSFDEGLSTHLQNSVQPVGSWSISIVPATSAPPFQGVDSFGRSRSGGEIPDELQSLLDTLPGVNLLPSLETYLILQADRLHRGVDAVDSEKFDGTYVDASYKDANWNLYYVTGQSLKPLKVQIAAKQSGQWFLGWGVRPTIQGDLAL